MVDRPVVIAVLQRVAGRRGVFVQRDIAQVDVVAQAAVIAYIGGLDHRVQRLGGVDVQSLREGVGEHRDGMVAAHAPVLVAHVAPDRQHVMRALLLVAYHRDRHVTRLHGFHQRQERMFGAVGIPERKDGVIGESVGLVDFPVEAAVAPVHIHIDRRIDHRMIIGGIEHRLLVLAALDGDALQFAVPCFGSRGPDLVETAAGSLGAQVLQRSFHAHGRQGDLHLQDGLLRGVELQPGDQFAPGHLREVVILVELAPAALVFDFFTVGETVFGDGL